MTPVFNDPHLSDLRNVFRRMMEPTDDAPARAQLAAALLESVDDCLVERPMHRRDEEALFFRQGDYWIIVYRGQRALLKATRGLQCLALLLRSPGREFHASELFADPMEPVTPSAATLANGSRIHMGDQLVIAGFFDGSPVLDAQAKAQYRHRLNELREEVAEAEERNDPHRAAKAQEEMDAITRHLASALGLGGRDRKTSSDAERARSAVTQRIRQAIQKIAEAIPPLGHHLTARIKTGYFCSYTPHPERPVAWKF